MVKVIVAPVKYDCEDRLGSFGSEADYDILVEEDTDCYMPEDHSLVGSEGAVDEKRLAFKFRKNYFSKEEQDLAYEGLHEAAVKSDNRGLASGSIDQDSSIKKFVTEEELDVIDFLINPPNELFGSTETIESLLEKVDANKTLSTRACIWLVAKIVEFDFKEWALKTYSLELKERVKEATRISETFISKTNYANAVRSGIAGWFDRYPRIPFGRATAYTENKFDKFQLSFKFLQTLNKGFKELSPIRYAAQKAAIDKMDKEFVVPETVFTTITVNKTFRTAYHRDKGDFTEGLSNLLVLSNDGNYTGGYLIFPEYRVAVNVRPGDLLLVNNHEIIHGNTPIVLGSEESNRVSLVCYLRENMIGLGVKKYEDLRKKFVEDRRNNTSHKEYRPLWNGISPSMWADDDTTDKNLAKEWYDYLKASENGEQYLKDYHPWLLDHFEGCGLDEFFQ